MVHREPRSGSQERLCALSRPAQGGDSSHLGPSCPEAQLSHTPPPFLPPKDSWRRCSELVGHVPSAADGDQGPRLGYQFPQLPPCRGRPARAWALPASVCCERGPPLIGSSPFLCSRSEEWGLFTKGMTVSSFLREAI